MGYQVVIPAAGSGKRMGAERNKLLINLLGKPLIAHTLQVFQDDGDCDGIILVVKPSEADEIKSLVREYGFTKVIALADGGNERQDSVRNGLMLMKRDGVVLIHDGARPFVSHAHIHQLVKSAETYGSAILAVPVKDTIKKVSDQSIQKTMDRTFLWAAQTPQAFRLSIILEAHEKAREQGYIATDDAALVEWMGQEVRIVHGNYFNIKITTPEDLELAEYYIKKLKGE
ncbi:MAG: 2-C-methyl-D-erythritol 4-phosphate cytidylyltransferase [Tuberibacillus sp.]